MSDKQEEVDGSINRRTVVKGAFVTAALGGFSGVAAGKGGKGNKGGGNGGETGYAGSGPYDPAGEGECSDCYRSQVFTLWAGQDSDAGTVTLSNDEDNIYVTYDTNESADLKEVHVDVYSTEGAVPDKRPAPGQADYKAENLYADAHTVMVPFTDLEDSVGCGEDFYVIAHAALVSDDASDDGEDADSDLSNEGETAYAGGSESALDDGKGAWFYVAEYTIECCCFDISGSVYEDGDGDATFDDGESGLGGIEVTLEDDAGNVVATTTADSDGTYTFEDIAGGEDYTVVVEAPEGYVGTQNSGGYEISDLDSDLTGADFGFTEDCGCLLTKYEWDDGEFVWEEGRDTLGIDGDEFDITVTETNEDGEPMAFEWESYSYDEVDPVSGHVPGEIYDVSSMTVKAGQDVETVEYDWASSGQYSREESKYAISNVQFCIECAFWQIDFAGAPIADTYTEDPEDRETHKGRLIAYGTHGRYGTGCGGVHQGNAANNLPVVDPEDATKQPRFTFDYDEDGIPTEASIEFEVVGEESVDLHLVAYEMPGPFDRSEIAWGPQWDAIEGTYEPGIHTITVDLPTCLEETTTDFTYNVETDYKQETGNIKYQSESEPALGEDGRSESDTFTFTADCEDRKLTVETKNQDTVSETITPGETVTMSNGFDVTWDSLTENDDGTWEYEFTVTSDADNTTGALSYVAFDTTCSEGSISP